MYMLIKKKKNLKKGGGEYPADVSTLYDLTV